MESQMATRSVYAVQDELQGVTTMPRGRRPKAIKAPNRLERCENIRQRILSLTTDLIEDGFGAVLAPPTPVKPIANPIQDPKTGGWIAMSKNPWEPTSNASLFPTISHSARRSTTLKTQSTAV